MPVYSSAWSFALKGSVSAGFSVPGTAASVGPNAVWFKLRNETSGTTNSLFFVSGGGGFSLAPVSFTHNLKLKEKPVRSSKATAFEEIHKKGAILWTASVVPTGGTAGPTASAFWFRISTGLFPYGSALFSFGQGSASMGGPEAARESWASSNMEVARYWGWVLLFEEEQEGLDPPVVPDPPVPLPPVPIIPDVPPRPPENKRKRVTFEADVLFDFDSARIKPAAAARLYDLIYEIDRRTAPSVTIEGHTDATGSDAYNMGLSKRRAEAVKQWLITHGAPNAHRYRVIGLGENHQVASNATSAGRAQNRRVEVIIE